MAFASDKGRQGAAGQGAAASSYSIDQSLRLDRSRTSHLSWTPSTTPNRTTHTYSIWFKLNGLGITHELLSNHSASRNRLSVRSDGALNYYLNDYGARRSTRLLRDPSAWYHVVLVVDTTNGTEADRFILYLNGERITNHSYYQNVPENRETGIHGEQLIGDMDGDNVHSDFTIAEVNFIDGQVLLPTDFGEFDADYNHWKPIEYAGSYGGTSFYLKFGNSASLGADSSGNSENWSLTNVVSTDQMLDSPTNNFATWNVLTPVDVTLSEGNLKSTNGSGYDIITATIPMQSGKWYWEILIQASTGYDSIGILDPNACGMIDEFLGARNCGSYGYNGWSGAKKANSGSNIAYGDSYASAGNVMGVAYDGDNGTITFYKNGVSQGQAFSGIDTTKFYTAGYSDYDNGTGGAVVANFGQDSSFAGNKTAQGNADGEGYGDFYYTPPTGYLALCTNNLPEPAVKPQENFNVVTYTGTGTTYNITGVGFQPDLVILKGRSIAGWHGVFDSVRGVNKRIHTDGVDAEQTRTADLNSFDSDGFQTDDSSGNGGYNSNTDTYVAWNWKAGTSASGTTSGSGTLKSYTASYNADAGFSIIKYEGNGTSNHKIPHHLGVAPDLVIVKNRDIDINWVVGHSSTGWGKRINLNNTSAHVGADTWNYVDPTTTLVNLGGGDTHQNGNGANDIMYCFASKEGYSKVFSHVGNGSSDGTFVYLGFKPAYALFRSYDNADAWYIFDRELDEYNVMTTRLRADNSYGPDTSGGNSLDFVSNGIKFRHADINGNGKKYIGIAFAEHPFKYTTAR